ncbi:hypothetical protein [Tissierella praeacuta]|uniref:hypothetical protein n=1 Tax=Tissierella praeacuta TaxID=43131 RepID=UPI0033429407
MKKVSNKVLICLVISIISFIFWMICITKSKATEALILGMVSFSSFIFVFIFFSKSKE